MTVISLSLDTKLLNRFEKVWISDGYHNRSEAMRTAIRDFIMRNETVDTLDDIEVEAIIVFTYHDSKDIRWRLEKIGNTYEIHIREKQHKHIVEDFCFDTIILRGMETSIRPIISGIRSIKGIEAFYNFQIPIHHEHY